MPISAVSTILRKALRQPDSPLEICTSVTHERYETNLCKTGHNFTAIYGPGIKPYWTESYAPIPSNYTIHKDGHLPIDIDFDLFLSQNKFGQYQLLAPLAQRMQVPVVSLEHTLPMAQWSPDQMKALSQMRGNINVFITDYQIEKWGFDPNDPFVRVIGHCVDTDQFIPGNLERKNHILTVANDYVNRDWCLNFKQYQKVTEGLPVFPVGDTAGLSRPAKDTEELISFYQSSRIFLSTAHISPIATSLLEAMACGCASVSVRACAVPEYIQHGVNGFLYDTDEEAREYLELLLSDEKLAEEMGKNAVETIKEKCGLNRYLREWNSIFDEVKDLVI